MHELSIADAIVRIATRAAGGRRVARVDLKVGHLRQVVPSALEFGFELVARDSPVEGAVLSIEEVPALGRCRRCGQETELPDFPLRCGACGDLDVEVIGGEELLVDSLELEDVKEMSMTNGGAGHGH
jgi:hydrogenase nickel incorporation protein HypA/HybF